MKTVSINTYQYNELTPAAQSRARDWFREGMQGDNYFAEYVYEDAKTIAALMGITIAHRSYPITGGPKGAITRDRICIYWSGFSSQGDGACFEGSWSASDVQAGKVLGVYCAPEDKELHRIAAQFESIAKEYPEAYFSVKHSGHYSHKNCTDFDVSLDDGEGELSEAEQAAQSQAEKDLIEAARDFMDWIYNQLESAYEYSISDEQVAEAILANEYEFTADGNRSVIL